jgi:hypothetical protein
MENWAPRSIRILAGVKWAANIPVVVHTDLAQFSTRDPFEQAQMALTILAAVAAPTTAAVSAEHPRCLMDQESAVGDQ